jgi:hypothetical protein
MRNNQCKKKVGASFSPPQDEGKGASQFAGQNPGTAREEQGGSDALFKQ